VISQEKIIKEGEEEEQLFKKHGAPVAGN